MSGDLRAAVEASIEAADLDALDPAINRSEAIDAVLQHIPEGAVLVTEETLAAALHERDEVVAVAVDDDSLRCDHPRECHEKAAAILRHLREGTE